MNRLLVGTLRGDALGGLANCDIERAPALIAELRP